MTTYTFKHGIHFQSGRVIEPRYSTFRWFKTIKGALRAGEKFAVGMDKYYTDVCWHIIIVVDREGKFITNNAT